MIDCKKIVNEMKEDLKSRVKTFQEITKTKPGLAIIQVGDNPASNRYVNGKLNDCYEVGIEATLYKLEQDSTEKDIISKIVECNRDDDIHGIIVQLPLPNHIDPDRVLGWIDKNKDVDGFHSELFIPCTPKGVLTLCEKLDVKFKNKTVTFVGYGKLVNRPLYSLISEKGATCVVCRSHTSQQLMETLCRLSDIVISSVGKHGLITTECISGVKPQLIIDCGIEVIDGKQYGDCSEDVYEEIDTVTPRVNGIGLLTRVSLLENVCKAAELYRCYHCIL